MARKMSAEEYQALGREYYKLKQYDKAIDTFTTGIEACPTASLYDYRAATYEKLDNFNASVKDGREMIRLNKKDVKGYLRTASVLEKMNKPETALGIYKYGMKNVPVDDKNFKLLQQLHDKLTRTLSPPAAMDPFTVLPSELAEMVFEYLTFRQKVNCMRVSKGWRDYLSKLPKLWLHLDLSGARRPVPRAFVNTMFKRSEYRMSRITIHRFEHMDVLHNLAIAAKYLTDMELISLPHKSSPALLEIVRAAKNLKRCIIHETITLSHVESILEARPLLEHVLFNASDPMASRDRTGQWPVTLNNLQSFTMHVSGGMYDERFDFTRFFSRTPSLRSFSLKGLTNGNNPLNTWPTDISLLPPLTSLSIKDSGRIRVNHLPPTLQSLEIHSLGFRDSLAVNELLLSKFPELTHLSLSGYENVPADFLHLLLDGIAQLDDGPEALLSNKPLVSLKLGVTVEDGDDIDLGTTLSFSRRVLTPALQHLTMPGMKCTDDDIEALVRCKTGLKDIDLSCTQITGAAIVMLADKVPTLESIK
ncbi:F-box TPR repeat containing protein pof3 [Pyrenophora tritici-repentis]|nr:F-box-TPR repeat containing protein pof3 [Pyrenophora tritici-repentis]KAI1526973.1 F-box TPR repeat containing protein pof3 [Pyrenophora tritici-repentis]KAI1527798.1 F-box TPR repeat containing protein pof3 [Pyrenophora tritici-repentis]KAI1535595.1 F-box TPR repeat containing protein pof3 [Pyrenophora tritici-repentis]KAI1565648.1 F-box TPR repeat containing protein pof3 [Pyrenophora tritici-repentis]